MVEFETFSEALCSYLAGVQGAARGGKRDRLTDHFHLHRIFRMVSDSFWNLLITIGSMVVHSEGKSEAKWVSSFLEIPCSILTRGILSFIENHMEDDHLGDSDSKMGGETNSIVFSYLDKLSKELPQAYKEYLGSRRALNIINSRTVSYKELTKEKLSDYLMHLMYIHESSNSLEWFKEVNLFLPKGNKTFSKRNN